MPAMVLKQISDLTTESEPLVLTEMPVPVPGPDQLLLAVSVCGVCHTEIDEIEGRVMPPVLPIIPGHQVIGRVIARGSKVKKYSLEDRVGVAWIFSSCGTCHHCKSGVENLCSEFQATGLDAHGGYASFMVVNENFAHLIPDNLTDEYAAPLLCAGAIGYRSLSLTRLENGQTLGLTGFGASGHLVLKLSKQLFPDSPVFVFARNESERDFAKQLGANWAGDTTAKPPEPIDSIIDTTPAWKPVVEALNCLKPGGRLVINAIRKESYDQNYLMNLEYSDHLWMEKEIKSVANITREDVRTFLKIADELNLKSEFQIFPLEEANRAIIEMKRSKIRGAKILKIHHE